MKKYAFLFIAIPILCLSSCTENYSNGSRIGTITQFSQTGNFYKSWEGHLNVTQTGMNSATGFDFSIDNDNEPPHLVKQLDSAFQNGWKVELTYHQVTGKNLFENRGHTDYFVTSCRVEDKNFSATGNGNSLFNSRSSNNQNADQSTGTGRRDTVVQITVTYNEARKAGWVK